MSEMVDTARDIRIQCAADEPFQAWLSQAGGSVVLSTYQAGKVAMIGWDGQQITLLMRQFDKPLGLAADPGRLALATRHEVTLFANAPALAYDYWPQEPGRYDALYLPRATFYTADLNIHDVAFLPDGLLVVNTRFSCLARLSFGHSFLPVWRPPFVSDLVPEDRCHLNGVAVLDGKPAFVTALGVTDTPGGWRQNKATGGVLLEVASGQVVVGGLCMPHSPRWHDGGLWLLNSGTGELVTVEREAGRATPVCRLPGYLRGLCFVGRYALVGLSRIRQQHLFGNLPIQQSGEQLRCGVAVVDWHRGVLSGLLEFTAGCEELYDVAFLPGIARPTILNLQKPAARQAVTCPEASYWLRPENEIPTGWSEGNLLPSIGN